jgi:hypothetical protein
MIVHPFTFRYEKKRFPFVRYCICSALEIFNPTVHPSIYKANTTNNLREVNSLFGNR